MAREGGKRGAYKVLMGKPVGNRPVGRFRLKWGGGTFKIDLEEVG